jgi:hypothetical protein
MKRYRVQRVRNVRTIEWGMFSQLAIKFAGEDFVICKARLMTCINVARWYNSLRGQSRLWMNDRGTTRFEYRSIDRAIRHS